MTDLRVGDDWLIAEPQLVARLKAEVPELLGVYSAEDLEDLEAQTEKSGAAVPSAHVFYLGDSFVQDQDGSEAGEIETIDQLWGVALVARNARGGASTRTSLGPLIAKVKRAIAGWDPGVIGLGHFRRAPVRATPRYKTGGKVIYPLFFYTRAIA